MTYENIIRIILFTIAMPLVALFTAWFVGRVGMKSFVESQGTDKYEFVMQQKSRYAWISFGTGIFILWVLAFVNNPDNPTMMWGVGLFLFLAVMFLFFAIKIRYDKIVVSFNQITVYRIFRRTKTFDRRDITKVREIGNQQGTIFAFYNGKEKLFACNSLMPNAYALVKRVLENEGAVFQDTHNQVHIKEVEIE